jgi:hypothetical protein
MMTNHNSGPEDGDSADPFDSVFRDSAKPGPRSDLPPDSADHTRVDLDAVPTAPIPSAGGGVSNPVVGSYATVAPGYPPPPPPPGYLGGYLGSYPSPPLAPLPGVAPTVLITFFFGLFGLIPASLHSDRARQQGQDGSRYWKAFWITFGSLVALNLVLVVAWFGFLAAMLASANSSVHSYPTSRASSAPTFRSTAPTLPSQTQNSDQSESSDPTQDDESEEPSSGDTGDEVDLTDTWVAVLDSVPKPTDIGVARTTANSIDQKYGISPSVIDSDSYGGLNPGYWVVVLTGYSSESEARAACTEVGRAPGNGCYGRHITG